MLSWAAMVEPHAGQRERPATNGSPRGTRWAMTVAKLPKISPAGMARMAVNFVSRLVRTRSGTTSTNPARGLRPGMHQKLGTIECVSTSSRLSNVGASYMN